MIPVAWCSSQPPRPPESCSLILVLAGIRADRELQGPVLLRSGTYGLWAANSLLYAGVGGVASTLVSTAAGYALAKFEFVGAGSSSALSLPAAHPE